jgi:hypothetical protein
MGRIFQGLLSHLPQLNRKSLRWWDKREVEDDSRRGSKESYQYCTPIDDFTYESMAFPELCACFFLVSLATHVQIPQRWLHVVACLAAEIRRFSSITKELGSNTHHLYITIHS